MTHNTTAVYIFFFSTVEQQKDVALSTIAEGIAPTKIKQEP
jgi:hypothetical protein